MTDGLLKAVTEVMVDAKHPGAAEMEELCEAQRLLIEAQSVLIKDQWRLIGALGGKVPTAAKQPT